MTAVACLLVLLPAAQAKPRAIPGWGTVTDPDGDCKLATSGDKLTVTVPATAHDLNASQKRWNAPRVLRPVTGDFAATVRVGGAFTPGPKPTREGGRPFVSAGVLVWADPGNYLRVERNALFDKAGERVCFPPLIELAENGKQQGAGPGLVPVPQFVKGGVVWLRVERAGRTVTVRTGSDGQNWTLARDLTPALPAAVQVGVLAINTGSTPLVATFDKFKLTAKD